MNRPAGRTPPRTPGAVSPPSPPEQAPVSNGPSHNTVDVDQVFAGGRSAGDALRTILGDRLTGKNEIDCLEACRQIRADITEWEAKIRRHREDRALILHLWFNNYSRRIRKLERNTWAWISSLLREPMATVHKWAHYIEVFFGEKDRDQD